MNEPWFQPGLGGLVGGAFGLLGGVYGSVVGFCAPRGVGRSAVIGFHFACLAASVAMLAVGLYALAIGQPFSDWYAFVLPGLLGGILFGAFTPMVYARYRQAEERKMAAADVA